MNKWVKIGGAIVIGGGLLLVAGAAGGVMYMGSAAEARLARTWDVKGEDIPVPFPLSEAELEALRQEKLAALPEGEVLPEGADPLEGVDLDALALERAVARGTRLANFQLGCPECHGSDLAGKLVADAQPVWTWYAPNITSGGKTAKYTTRDWDRIVRHGVKPDGTTATMPAEDFKRLADRDLSDLIAWAQSFPPSDAVMPPTELGPVGKILLGTGTLPLAAERIDHGQDTPEYPPERAVTVEYGQYVAQTCVGCHREDYTGGPIAQGPPDWPPARNLTPHAEGLQGWTKDQWMAVFRSGKRPDGTDLNPVMPWAVLGQMGEVELEAAFLYLQSIEGLPTGK